MATGVNVYRLRDPQRFQIDGVVSATESFSSHFNDRLLHMCTSYDVSSQLRWIETGATLVVAPDCLEQLKRDVVHLLALSDNPRFGGAGIRSSVHQEIVTLVHFIESAMERAEFIAIDAEPNG
jgi:hypothetical protein